MHPHDYENLKTASRPAKRPADRSVRYSYSPVSGRDVSRSDIPPRSALQQRHGPKVGFHNPAHLLGALLVHPKCVSILKEDRLTNRCRKTRGCRERRLSLDGHS